MSTSPLLQRDATSIASWRPPLSHHACHAKKVALNKISLWSAFPCLSYCINAGTALSMAAHPLSTLVIFADLVRTRNFWWSSACLATFYLPSVLLRSILFLYSEYPVIWQRCFGRNPGISFFYWTNVRIILKELTGQELAPHEGTYIKLYRLMDCVFGGIPWVVFSLYMYVRLHYLPENEYAHAVDPRALILNIALSLFNAYLSIDFFAEYSPITTGGNQHDFTKYLLSLGEDSVKLSTLRKLRTKEHVVIDSDLSHVSGQGMRAIGRAVKSSRVLRSLAFKSTGLGAHENILQEDWDSMFVSFALNRQLLRSLSFDPPSPFDREELHYLFPDMASMLEQFWNGGNLVISRSQFLPMRRAIADDNSSVVRTFMQTSLPSSDLVCLAAFLDSWRVLRSIWPVSYADEEHLLLSAARGGADACVGLLIFARVNVDCPRNSLTALREAVNGGHARIAKQLISAGASINIGERGEGGVSPLHTCGLADRVECATLLIKARAEVNLATSEGVTPLMHAAHSNAAQVVQELLKANASLDSRDNNGYSALAQTAAFGAVQACQILLLAKADANVRDPFGLTVPDLARHSGHREVLALLQDFY